LPIDNAVGILRAVRWLFLVVLFVVAAGSNSQAGGSSWMARPAYYEVFVRDFSPEGNFAGVENGLDQIQATGANVIWLMPIYPIGQTKKKFGPIGSPYSVSDYHTINPAYGTEEDLHRLVNATHARDMKVILDFVANHTSWDHVWLSTRPDWYLHDAAGRISVPIDASGRPTPWTDTAGLNYKNPELRPAIIAEMRYWVEQFGVDGFRMDVAALQPDDFWAEAIPTLQGVKPLLMLAEAGEPKMHNDGFDLTYGWDAYHQLIEIWNGRSAEKWVARQVEDIAGLPNNGRRLRFTTNHDETSGDAPVKVFHGSAGTRAAFVAMTLLPGVPSLYNGQEVESPQRISLFDRQPIKWDQPDAENTRSFYARVIQLERTQPAFAGNDLEPITTSNPRDVIAYRRANVAVLVNTRARPVTVELYGTNITGGRDLLSDRVQPGNAIELDGYCAAVIEFTGR
jgi:YD repeat-containing protein